MKVCNQCGASNSDNDVFCRNCGAKMIQVQNNTGYGQNINASVSQRNIQNVNMPQNGTTVPQGHMNTFTNNESMAKNQGNQIPYMQSGNMQNTGNQPNMGAMPMPQKPAKKDGSALGIVSMICGIAALVFFWVIIPGWICGTAAVILGIIQCVSHRKKGMAITGLVTGGLAFIASTAFFIFALLSDDITTENGGIIDYKSGEDYLLNIKCKPVSTDIGTFELIDDWNEDSASTESSDGYIYAPEGSYSYSLSDYIYVGGIDSDFTFAGRDELIQVNVDAIVDAYPELTESDVTVTTELDYEAPAVVFDYYCYDDYYEDNVHVVEKYLMYDGALVAMISYDFDTWENDLWSPEEIMNHMLETFKVARAYS